MAVFVDISDTLHLAYSPLNEKHNVLYNRARQIFNQRFIQKPWFNLSPFLDKEAFAPRLRPNLENFAPDDFKGVQPLQSLCIVENYFNDRPLSKKELKIGEFWDFLFSSGWEEGHSVRVLEGRLLEMLVSTLVHLNRTGEVAQHTTLAYAKNRRPRCSVYKHSTKPTQDQYLRSGEETLLLEFIYYGRAVNYEPEGSSVGYAGSSTTWPQGSTFSEDIESSDTELQGEDPQSSPRTTDNPPAIAKPPPDKDKYSKFQQKRFRKRIRYTTENPRNETDSELSISEHIKSTMPKHRSEDILRQHAALRVRGEQASLSIIHERILSPKSKPIPRKETLSNFSSGSDYTQAPAMVDLKKFMCTEKVKYLGEYNIESDSDHSDTETDENFGQEFYLGDVKKPEFDTYEEMLQNKKHVLGYIRQRRRQESNKRRLPKKSILPVLSELDVKKYVSDTEIKEKKDEDDRVPDLEEYVIMMKEHADMLREMERMERLREIMEKHQKIKKKTSKMFRLIKIENERFGDEVGGVTDSIPCKLHCYDQDSVWKHLRDKTKHNFLAEKLSAAGGKVTVKPKKKVKREPKVMRKLIVPLVYVTTITGITYLHPVSKQMLQQRWEEKAANLSVRMMQKIEEQKRIQSMKSLTPALALEYVIESEEEDTEKPMFPKARPLVTGKESPDIISDDESDDFEDTDFDTEKLNKQYSIEKIRKIKREHKARERARRINQVLQKYFRMQTVLKAFTPKPKPLSGRRNSLSRNRFSGYSAYHLTKPKKPKQTKVNLPKLPRKTWQVKKEQEETSEEEEMTIGKLKHYRFLNASKTPTPKPTEDAKYEERHDAFPMEDFQLNVERALEEFVVRREIIVSDSSYKKSVSVTFTKKSVFTKSKYV